MQLISAFCHSNYAERLLKIAGTVCITLTVVACSSTMSGTGPYSSSIVSSSAGQDPNLPYKLVALTPENVAQYSRQAPPPASAYVSSTDSTTMRLVAGDVIKVMVSDSADGGVFAHLSQGGTVFNNVRIASNGTISLPYVGAIKIAGNTLTQINNAIRKRLVGSVATDPQVHTELVGDMSGSVLVAGAVKTPGRFSSLQGALTILDVINMAGGPVLEPHLINVIVRNGKQVYTINYDEVLAGNNRQLSPRSEVILERARQRFVAMGAVKDPGLKDLPSRNPSLLEVLGSVGGLEEHKADPQGVFVFRINPHPRHGDPEAEVFRLDMRKPESIFLARAFLIFPEDAIYVTNAPVYEWQKIISPIVQTLVLGRAVNNF